MPNLLYTLAVDTPNIANNAVTTEKIADHAVSETKLIDRYLKKTGDTTEGTIIFQTTANEPIRILDPIGIYGSRIGQWGNTLIVYGQTIIKMLPEAGEIDFEGPGNANMLINVYGVGSGYHGQIDIWGASANNRKLSLYHDDTLARIASNYGDVLIYSTHTYRVRITSRLRLYPLASPPTTPPPLEGEIYANGTDHKLYYYNGTTWIDLTA
jgi:hypothetical protein